MSANSVSHFTATKVKFLRIAYLAALKRGDESFPFEGQELLVAYAKYLLEYLDSQFDNHKE